MIAFNILIINDFVHRTHSSKHSVWNRLHLVFLLSSDMRLKAKHSTKLILVSMLESCEAYWRRDFKPASTKAVVHKLLKKRPASMCHGNSKGRTWQICAVHSKAIQHIDKIVDKNKQFIDFLICCKCPWTKQNLKKDRNLSTPALKSRVSSFRWFVCFDERRDRTQPDADLGRHACFRARRTFRQHCAWKFLGLGRHDRSQSGR